MFSKEGCLDNFMMKKKYIYILFFVLSFYSCQDNNGQPDIIPIQPPNKEPIDTVFIKRAETTFENVFNLYWDNKVNKMYSSYPINESPHYYEKYASAWGYGAILSAYNAVFQHTASPGAFEREYKNKIIDGLEKYWTKKYPGAYAAYDNDWDDRFYDDNVWFGIDLIELYERTKDTWFLDKAKAVWTFIMSGKDDVLGGGVYWKEGEKNSKNTCSNAPAVVLGVKMYQSTRDMGYLNTAKEIYRWTKSNLRDPMDNLYWDNMKTNGTVEKTKFSYNSGQMIQAATLLYNETKETTYLNDAKAVAEASYNYFFEDYASSGGDTTLKVLKKGSVWFNTIMLRGFVELNKIEPNNKYSAAFRQSLENAWKYARETDIGLFNSDFNGGSIDKSKDILYQGAIVEMYVLTAILQ
ncbi:MAG: hypothetical protein BGO29_05785 [Bacteroidales bacterium 36-12]|mgnify:CR=1 FL=1|nr:MAG: hypothetical protein BGO29_05785 [Bacteroidales bacterium 36-12]